MKPTPLEEHEGILVKREDLNEYGFPSGKLRGLIPYMHRLKKAGVKKIVNAGATHSNSHAVVAFASKLVGLECHSFVNTDSWIRNQHRAIITANQVNSKITIHTTKPMHIGPLKFHASLWAKDNNAFMIPWGLTCPEIIKEYARAVDELPRFKGSTLHVVPFGAGGWAVGVYRGTCVMCRHMVQAVPAMPTKKDASRLLSILYDGKTNSIELPEGLTICRFFPKKPSVPPFPCDPKYEYPAWLVAKFWLAMDHGRIVFWNIGTAMDGK